MRLSAFIKFNILLLCILFGISLSSCSKDEPTPTTQKKTAILVYAVASNSLSGDFQNDKNEMLEGLKNVDLNTVDFYLYSIDKYSDNQNPPALAKAVKEKNGVVKFKTVKTYDRNTFSTDPDRISEVISDFRSANDAQVKGLFLWSHATSWVPAWSDHIVNPVADVTAAPAEDSEPVKVDLPMLEWFGQDSNGSQSDFCDIIELADAIPDHYFDFIWWDCCYMSSIEVAYQFRNKSDYMVAYPTEVLAEGAPYDLILPYIAKENPNLTAAADAMSDYYTSYNKPYTIAILDLSAIEDVADLAKEATFGTRIPKYKLLKYSRGAVYFYDFGQYTRTWGESLGEEWDTNRFNAVMDRFVIFKSSSNILINKQEVTADNFYGISTHYINLDFDPSWASPDDWDLYYLKLDWYNRIFGN